MSKIKRALSVRQPFAQRILDGTKDIEYRSRPTNIRERVYIYASKKQYDNQLPTGVIVGSVEIIGCEYNEKLGQFEWILANPIELKRHKKPKNKPQPVFFYPF